MQLETPRLVVRDLRDDDLEAVLPVHTSNPQYLALTEGSSGEPGLYDLARLQRDVAMARLQPGRHAAGIFLAASGEPAGALDWLEENPEDGMAWVGLVIVRADLQRRGIASEACRALATALGESGHRILRAACFARNAPGLALAAHLGFEPVAPATRRAVAGPEEMAVLELGLTPEPQVPSAS